MTSLSSVSSRTQHWIFPMAMAMALGVAAPASAQELSASSMWGTMYGGVAVSGAATSAQVHTQNGVIAGQVNAGERGYLVSTGSSGTIQAIGSQTIVSSTIYGNSNSASINATQSSVNSGQVTNEGTLN